MNDFPTAREQLVAALKPILPREYLLIETQRSVDELSSPIVILKQETIEQLDAAPKGAWATGYTLTLVDNHVESATAEAALDEAAGELWASLQSSTIRPTIANKVLFANKYLAYDFTIQVITSRKVTTDNG